MREDNSKLKIVIHLENKEWKDEKGKEKEGRRDW
jgi:hypothetical protein